MVFNYLLVFIGGGLGSICRFGIAHLLSQQKFTFPFATLIANIVSCVILGYLVGWSLKNEPTDYHRFLLMTGCCGGFSTFSTFSSETFQLFQAGAIFYGMANIVISLVVCLVFIYIGIKLGSYG